MFSDTELALMNRANLAERETDRIIGQYRGMIRELKEALQVTEDNANDLYKNLQEWIGYAKKLDGRINNAKEYMRRLGLGEGEIDRIIKG